MKSHYKLFLKYILTMSILLSSIGAYSRDIILIENLASPEEGQLLLKIIHEKFNIPKKLITYREIKSECIKTSDAIMQLCLNANGEMDIVKINKIVIAETFRIFSEVGK